MVAYFMCTIFLIDTGAGVSVIPPTRMERSHPHSTFALQVLLLRIMVSALVL